MRVPLSVRHAISLPIRRIPVSIQSGPNRGKKWSITASGQGIASGQYERDRFDAFAALIHSDDVLWDVGANHGYASLVAANAISATSGEVHAFEPSEYNRWYLRQHLSWNDAEHVQIESVAVADYVGTSMFGGSGSSAGFALGKGAEQVAVSTLTHLVSGGMRAPTFIKVDIEGAETSLLKGAADFMSGAATRGTLPLILMSVHSPAHYRDCRDLMLSFGYQVIASHRLDDSTQQGATWDGDPDLLAVAPGRDVSAAMRLPWFARGQEMGASAAS